MSWKERVCVQQSCRGGGSAANSVQLVGEAAEAVMPGLSILVFILVMRQIHRITVCVLGTCGGVVLVAQKPRQT